MKTITKKRRNELRELYDKIQGEKYVKGIQEQPFVGLMEWVDLMVDYRDNKPTWRTLFLIVFKYFWGFSLLVVFIINSLVPFVKVDKV